MNTSKIRLVNGDTYPVTRAEVTHGRLEIDFEEKSCEEIQKIFLVRDNLETIELLNLDDEKYGEIVRYTVYSGVTLVGEIKTVILSQKTDPVQERLTSVEAKALEATILAQNAKTETTDIAQQVTDLQLAMCEMYEGMGV